MNRVVVGFDFSSGSANAVDLAIDIANRWQSDIRLVYVKEKNENEAPIRAEIEQRNAAVEPLLKGIKLEYVLREGSPAEQLAKQAEEDNAALLIVGTHGMSGLKTNMLGRNSYRTIELSPVPVLIVREDFNFNKALETIVVPIDSSDWRFSMSMAMPISVFISDTLSAPSASTACAISAMLVTLGDSFTINVLS